MAGLVLLVIVLVIVIGIILLAFTGIVYAGLYTLIGVDAALGFTGLPPALAWGLLGSLMGATLGSMVIAQRLRAAQFHAALPLTVLALLAGIVWGGPTGRGRTLQGTGDAGPAVAAPSPRYRVTASRVRLRSGPSTEASILGHLGLGQEVVPLASRGPWIQVHVASPGQPRVGWVHRDYVKTAD